MNQLERDELKDKLDDFSRRLDAQHGSKID